MLNHFVVLCLVAAAVCGANGDEDMFLNKAQSSPASTHYHVKWLTDFIKFPLSFEKQCRAGEEDQYVWRRHRDGLFIGPSQKFDSYAVTNGEQKTKLTVTRIHLDHPEELAIYEPLKVSAQPDDVHVKDMFAFAYLKSHSILVNKTQDMINVTCVADFMVPNGFNEDINDGILAQMERNAIFKMTMNSLNAVKKEKPAGFMPPASPMMMAPEPTTTTTSTTTRATFVQADNDLERQKEEKDEFVKAQLKSLLSELHKNHHPEKQNRDPNFSQTWSHIQRSSPRPSNPQNNGRPRAPMPPTPPPMDDQLFSNQIFQAQKKVQDRLMMLQNGAPVMPVHPEVMFNPMHRIPALVQLRPQQVPAMPFAVPLGMQMPMFAFMNKRKRFIRQADGSSQPEETAEVPEVTSQIIPSGEQSPLVPEPIQQIRLKYGPITLYRPLRQAEIITCNLKLVNHDDMKIDHQSTIFATVRKDTGEKKAKPETVKTNPQYEAEDEAKWAKELQDITSTLKKKIQLGLTGDQELPAASVETTTTTTTESTTEPKLDQYEAELQKPEFSETPKTRAQASAIKKAHPSSSARSSSVDLALFSFTLLVYYFTAL